MTVRVSHINSNVTTLVNDYDHSFVTKWAIGEESGVLFSNLTTKPEFDLDTTSGVVSTGECVIIGTRTASQPVANEKMMLRVKLYESETVALTVGNKIYIEIDNTLLQDQTQIEDTGGSTDYALGKNIGELKSTASYPTHPNYIKLWEITSGPTYTDVRNATRISDDAIDLTNNSDFQDLETDVETNATNIAALSGGATLIDAVAGEDIDYGLKEGCVFRGRGEEEVLQETDTGTLSFGDTSVEKIRLKADVADLPSISKILREVSFKFKKIGTPTDKVKIMFFTKYVANAAILEHMNEIVTIEIDYTELTTTNTFIKKIAGKLQTNKYYNTQLAFDEYTQVKEGEELYIEISRTGSQDATNYYGLGYTASDVKTGYSFETYNGATRSSGTGDLCFRLMFGFTKDKIRKSNQKMEETAIVDGIVNENILEGETGKLLVNGYKLSSDINIGENYYLNNNIIGPGGDDENYFFMDNATDRPPLYTPFTVTEDSILLGCKMKATVKDDGLGGVYYVAELYEDNGALEPTVKLADLLKFRRSNPQGTTTLTFFYLAVPIEISSGTKVRIKEKGYESSSENIHHSSTRIGNTAVSGYPIYNTEGGRGVISGKSPGIQPILLKSGNITETLPPQDVLYSEIPSDFLIGQGIKTDKIKTLMNEQNALRLLGLA